MRSVLLVYSLDFIFLQFSISFFDFTLKIQFYSSRKFTCLVQQDVRTTKNLKFVVDEDDDEDEECDEDANELFDHVCTICDNGGELLW